MHEKTKNPKHFPTVKGLPHPEIIRSLIAQYKSVEPTYLQISQLLAVKFPNGLPAEFTWAHLYEKPLMELLMVQAQSNAGIAAKLSHFSKQHDPNLAVMRETNLADPEGMVDEQDFVVGNKDDAIKRLVQFYACLRVMARSLQSVAIHYKPMSSLMREALAGNKDSLFHAIKIDRAVSTLPFVLTRFSNAEAMGDKDFLAAYRNAINYDFDARATQVSALDNLRLACFALSDFPSIETATTTRLMDYLINDVGLKGYDSENTRDTLRKHINNLRD